MKHLRSSHKMQIPCLPHLPPMQGHPFSQLRTKLQTRKCYPNQNYFSRSCVN